MTARIRVRSSKFVKKNVGPVTKAKSPRPSKRATTPHPNRERQFLALWDKCTPAGSPSPTTQHRFHKKRKWLFDFAWPDRKFAVEYEGGIYNAKSGHRTAAGVLRDIEKYNAAALDGWCVYRLTSKDLDHNPAQTISRVLAAVMDRTVIVTEGP